MESEPRIVLVADADEDTRRLCDESATHRGWDVVGASDGRDALVKALIRPPTLVLTELTLPLMDGFALCDILRRDPATTKIPILVVTAETRPQYLARARRVGAQSVLVKPVDPEAVLEEMHRLVAAAAMSHQGDAAMNSAAAIAAVNGTPAVTTRRRSREFPRGVTKTPPVTPPSLVCPGCDGRLFYEHSHIGGVNERQPEQWDRYWCASCGCFQYRHRTRVLRRVS